MSETPEPPEPPAPFSLRTGKRKREAAYEIKEIINNRKRYMREREYEVTWYGYDTTDWISARNFCTPGAYDLLTEYRRNVLGVHYTRKKYPKFVITDEPTIHGDDEQEEAAEEPEQEEEEEVEAVDTVELEGEDVAEDEGEEVETEVVDSADLEVADPPAPTDGNNNYDEFDDLLSQPDEPVPNLTLEDVMLPPRNAASFHPFHVKEEPAEDALFDEFEREFNDE